MQVGKELYYLSQKNNAQILLYNLTESRLIK